MLIFLGRDLLTIIGGSYLFYIDIRREFKATLIGKLTLFFQIIALVPAILGEIDWVLMWTSIVFTAISAIELIFKSEFRLTRKTDISEFRITKLLKISDIFTLANVIFGLTAIFYAINKNYDFARGLEEFQQGPLAYENFKNALSINGIFLSRFEGLEEFIRRRI